MSPNQKKGICLLIGWTMILSIPVLIFGIPVPDEFILLYIFSVIPLILGMCLVAKTFDFDYKSNDSKRVNN